MDQHGSSSPFSAHQIVNERHVGALPMVMVPVPMHLVPRVNQLLASYAATPSAPSTSTSELHPSLCSLHPISRSEQPRDSKVHNETTREIAQQDPIGNRITPRSCVETGSAEAAIHESDAIAFVYVGRAAQRGRAQMKVAIGKSLQTRSPRAITRSTLQKAEMSIRISSSNTASHDSPPDVQVATATAGDTMKVDGLMATTDDFVRERSNERTIAQTNPTNTLATRAKKSRTEKIEADFATMESDNEAILAQDRDGTWDKGVCRFNASAESAAQVLAWVVENTSRKRSVVATDALSLDGFHEWDAVHASTPNDARQLQHTFVISRRQRRAAIRVIPGLATLVSEAQKAIESMQLADTPATLKWLTGHILNQGDVNARFEFHQDTNEERDKETGRRDRRVMYTAIIKLNFGGCTSMEVCGQPEVFYHSLGGSGVIFRSNLHHRTEKAEQGVWKFAMFFGIFT